RSNIFFIAELRPKEVPQPEPKRRLKARWPEKIPESLTFRVSNPRPEENSMEECGSENRPFCFGSRDPDYGAVFPFSGKGTEYHEESTRILLVDRYRKTESGGGRMEENPGSGTLPYCPQARNRAPVFREILGF